MTAPKTPSVRMEHPDLENALVAERYVLGRLSGEEARAFEEHFLDCSRCVEAVETSRSFADAWRGLSREEATDAMRSADGASASPLLRFPASIPRTAPYLLAAGLAVAVVSAAFFYTAMRRAERARTTAELALRREPRRHPGTVRKAPETLSVQQAPAIGTILATASSVATVFPLEVTRSTESATGQPIGIDGESGWAVFLFDRPDGPATRRLRANLESSDRARSVATAPVASGPSGLLAAAFPAGALPAGDYLLQVEGASGAEWEVLARYRLRVSHRPADSPTR